MLRPEYPITTERLLLRPFVADDLDGLHRIHSRADVTRYLYWEPWAPAATRDALARRQAMTQLTKAGDGLQLAVALRDSGEMVGDVNLHWTSDVHAQGEVGFVLHPDVHGRGYAGEAATAMLRLGFEQLGLHRIVGRLDGRNRASARVLEKLGMRREAHLRENEWVKGEWTDEVVYALLADEWRDRG